MTRRAGDRLPAAAALAALLIGSSCGPATSAARRDDNVLIVTVCGLRSDVLTNAISDGRAPELARLRERATVATEITVASTDCLESHRALFTGGDGASGPGGPHGETIAAALHSHRYSSALFASRSELFPGSERGFDAAGGPPIERFSADLFGEHAAAVRLRRSADATARAAVDWLAKARSPFLLAVQLDALAIESTESADALASAAARRLAEVDAAVATLQRELERAGRDRRTLVVLTADHGEAFGEEGWYGHRRALPSVARVPLWIVDPGDGGNAGRALQTSSDLAPWIAARLALPAVALGVAHTAVATNGASVEPARPRESGLSKDAAPVPFLVERFELPLTDEGARAQLPELRRQIQARPDDLEAAELYLVALHALKPPTEEEKAETADARRRWLDRVVDAPARGPLLPAIAARSDLAPESSAARRLEVGQAALARWPWYFPSARAVSTALQMKFDAAGAISVLEQFGRDAPLSTEARAEFEKQLEVTRRGVLPGRPRKQ